MTPGPADLHPLPAVEVGWTDEDLVALDEIVGDARFVGLGESVHTSGGYYEAKRQLFRHLVEHDGFRVMAMETPRTAAELASRYVATCEGVMPDAITSIFAVFADASTGDLLTWMCGWNQQHPDDPVTFTGFDVQQERQDRARLGVLLADHAPEVFDGLSACQDRRRRPTRRCMRALDELDAALADATWDGAVEARRCAIGMRASRDRTPAGRYDARDLGMADVLESLASEELAGKRIVIWAHDGHLARDWPHSADSQRFVSLGTHLARRHGEDYVAIGFVGGDVLVNWAPGIPDRRVESLAPDDVEHRLHQQGVNAALVDLRTTTLFSDREAWGMFGAHGVPRDQFDALLYLDRSRAMLPVSRAGLPGPLVLPPEAASAPGHLRYHVPGVDRPTTVAAHVRRAVQTDSTVISRTDEQATTALVLSGSLDDTTTEVRVTEAEDGVDVELRWTPPPQASTLAEVRAAPSGVAVRVTGRLAADGKALVLEDGSLGLEPGTFPAGWGGLRLSVTCRVTNDRLGPCRQAFLTE
ncbi:MAG: erythromycin esterase family protein [Myxococcales bacterium]|nr:erythromycin esterase family protein [Myxococcales bacterium]